MPVGGERTIRNILITGGKGQLGGALHAVLHSDYTVVSADLPEADITQSELFASFLAQAEPDLVIHCAAFTDVDGSARNPEIAYRVNALGTRNVALSCRNLDIPLLHISTNEVFDGDRPAGYDEWMPLNPINPYGRSKAASEEIVRGLLTRYYIVRIAWLFSPGGRNFVHTILRHARAGGRLRVVTDEVGNPTYAPDVARAIAHLIATDQYGFYHLVNSGACSRWAFAREALRQAGLDDVPIEPIRLQEFKRLSTPPRFGALNNNAAAALGITLRPWQEALADFLHESAGGDVP